MVFEHDRIDATRFHGRPVRIDYPWDGELLLGPLRRGLRESVKVLVEDRGVALDSIDVLSV